MGLLTVGCGGGGGDGIAATTAKVASASDATASVSSDGQTHETIRPLTKDAPGAEAIEASINKPYRYPGLIVDVAVGAVTPSVIEAALYEGSVMPDVVVNGTATGNLALLNGKTLYVYVEDPVGFFQASAQAYPTRSPSPGLSVWLRGAPQSKPGAHRGFLTVNVCLDAGCASRVRQIYIPYKVDILRGYRAGGQATQDPYPSQPVPLQVDSAFGEVIPAGHMVLVPPERAPVSSLYANWFGTSGEWEDNKVGNEPVTRFVDNKDGTVTFNVEFPPQMTPGTRTGTFYLFTSYVQQPAYSRPPAFAIRLSSVISPHAGVPVVFSPASLALSVRANTTSRPTSTIRVAAGDPAAVLQYDGMEPTMDADRLNLLPAAGWAGTGAVISASNIGGWAGSPLQYVFPAGCATWWPPEGGSATACLPPGVYDFRLRYRHTLQGVVTFFYYPVQLTITP